MNDKFKVLDCNTGEEYEFDIKNMELRIKPSYIDSLETYIVKFDDGTYFNGVKSKYVRKTKHFKDAKIIDNGVLSDRNRGYLSRMNYELIRVRYTIEEF